MSSTYSALHVHVVFSTKHRENWLLPKVRSKVYAYIGGCVRGMNGIAHAVGGTVDHVHILMGIRPVHCLADMMRELKAESSKWIKEACELIGFSWQDGYDAFSVSPPDLEKVKADVLKQEVHHRNISFQEEYVGMLKRGLVEYDEKYLW